MQAAIDHTNDLITNETKIRTETFNSMERLIEGMERDLIRDIEAETSQREET